MYSVHTIKNRVDYFELKKRLRFVNRPLFEFCGAYVNYLDLCYGLSQNDPKIIELASKQKLYNDVMVAFDIELSPFVKEEIKAFSFSNILQNVLKAFLFDFQSINSFDVLIKKYDSLKIEKLFDFIGGTFINEHSQSNCEDWPSASGKLAGMKSYIEGIEGLNPDLKAKIISLYEYPKETKMRIKHVICSMYEVFKQYEPDCVELAKKQQRRYANLMEIDYEYFCHILKFDDIADAITGNEQVDLYISYMFPVSYFCKEYDDSTAFLLNGFLCDEYHASKVEQNSVDTFLSLIGDIDSRKILMAYAKAPHYLQELSRELDITPAKLRLYNKRFLDADLIDYEYTGGRRYYYLNKEQVNTYLDMCRRIFG